MTKKITLKLLINCPTEHQSKLLEIRNQPSIREAMYTSHKIELNEHLVWLNKLKEDKKQIVFIVFNEHQNPLGAVSLNAIDHLHKKADWAFYLDDKARNGLGAALEYSLIEYAFNILMLEKLNCEVIESNKAVLNLHKKFCFFEEGYRRENIEKQGKRIGVYFLGLTKTDWLRNKHEIYQKYQPVLDKFEIDFENININ